MARFTGTPEEVAQQIVSQAKAQGAIRVTADVEFMVVQTSIFEAKDRDDPYKHLPSELEGKPF